MSYLNEDKALLTEIALTGNKFINCIAPGCLAVNMAEVLKLQPEVKRLAAACKKHRLHDTGADQYKEIAVKLAGGVNGPELLAELVAGFVGKITTAPKLGYLIPLAVAYLPIMEHAYSVCLDDFTELDFELPI